MMPRRSQRARPGEISVRSKGVAAHQESDDSEKHRVIDDQHLAIIERRPEIEGDEDEINDQHQ